MEPKEYYIKEIQSNIISFNEFWEDPITDSILNKTPLETAEELISYCGILKAKYKRLKKDKVYDKFNDYAEDVQRIIRSMVSLVTDDRPLREKHEYHNCKCCFNEGTQSREYDHGVDDNKFLPFENFWYERIDRLEELCEELIKVVTSENETRDLEQFVGKSFEYCHYEDGSYVITLDKISKVDDRYLFDGKITYYTTVNTRFDMDGILMQEVEDYPFDELPFVEEEEVETRKALAEFLENGEEKTLIDIANDVRSAIINYFEGVYNVNVS